MSVEELMRKDVSSIFLTINIFSQFNVFLQLNILCLSL